MSIVEATTLMIAVVLCLELIFGWHRGIYRKQDFLITGGCYLLNQLTRPLAAFCFASLFAWLLPAYRGVLSDAPLLPSAIILLLVAEFAFYWVHRLAHDPVHHKLLYGLHRTHHSSRYLNVTVMARINIFWGFVVPYAWIIGGAVYLGLGAASAIVIGVLIMWNTWTHSALRWDDLLAKSPLGSRFLQCIEWLFITPRIHHAHHGWGKDGKTYRNFGVALTLYDRLFGTLYIPQGRPEKYGLPLKDRHWLEDIMFPLFQKDKFMALVGRKNKDVS